jgi:hypothetical protein
MCASCLRLFEEQTRAIANLDRELQQVLAIEPSPRFAPQVLARVRRPSRWRSAAWWGLPLAAAAALLLVMFGSLRSGERTTVEREHVAAATDAARPPAIDSQPPQVAGRSSKATEAPRVTPSRRPAPRAIATRKPVQPAAPEILVPADASRALARYVELVRRGAIDTSTLAEPAASGAEAPSHLVIAPLSVEAISVMDVERRSGPGGDERDRGLR